MVSTINIIKTNGENFGEKPTKIKCFKRMCFENVRQSLPVIGLDSSHSYKTAVLFIQNIHSIKIQNFELLFKFQFK